MFNEKLKKAYAEFQEMEMGQYRREPLPEVLSYLTEYKATGKFPYNSDVAAYIRSRENIDQELYDYLETEVYLAQKALDRAEKLAFETACIKDGYIVLTSDELPSLALLDGSRVLFKIDRRDEMFGGIRDTECKVKVNGERIFLIPKRNRTRGYLASGYVGLSYYKVIN